MKLPYLKMSKPTKQTLTGGVLGALAVHMESAANFLVAGYPQPLKDRLAPQLPRNGELVADIAPAGIVYVVARKKRSEKIQNIKNGVYLYDFPKLLNLVGYRIAYTMGAPAAGAAAALPLNNKLNLTLTPSLNRYAPPPAGMGRYQLKVTPAKSMGGGIGKYR